MNLHNLIPVIKDCFIIITLVLLVLAVLQIKKLKKTISAQTQRRLIPQLALDLVFVEDALDNGIYLKNESFFLAKDIKIDDAVFTMDEYGFKKDLTLKFGSVEFLKPQEKIRLNFKVYDKEHYLDEVTQKIFPHLPFIPMNVTASFLNIENVKLMAVFVKKKDNFFTERTEPLEEATKS
jgi:hypothetical protein